jgi:transposase-like protein
MLEFLWPGANKSGQPAAETSAGIGSQERSSERTEFGEAKEVDTTIVAANPEGTRADARETLAGELSREEEVRSGAEEENPLVTPGGPAEFTEDAANVQDEVGGSRLPPEEVKGIPLLAGRRRGKRLVKKEEKKAALTAQQRLVLLDACRRSELPISEFANLVGLSRHTLYAWKKRFDREGPAGLLDQPKGGPRGSRLPELTKRTILMLKQANPSWG